MLQDLKDFMAKVKEDEALQERMGEIVKSSEQEEIFDNCNAVAAEMGYTIVEDDMRALAEEYQEELSDEELDKVSGGIITEWIFTITVVVSTATSAGVSAVSILRPWKEKKQ